MNDKASKNSDSDGAACCAERCLPSDMSVYFILALAVLISYGYEIFNFNITIDEEVHADYIGGVFEWVNQGRWGMALLSYILIPKTIVPAVSVSLGLFGTTAGILTIIRSSFVIDRAGLLFITALGITIPTFPFIFTFSSIAYGIGAGFIAISLGNSLTFHRDIKTTILACLLAGFAISIYQPFVFAVAMVAILQIWHFCATAEYKISNDAIKFPALFLFGGIAAYLLVDIIVRKLFQINITYVGGFVDINGFLNTPIKKLLDSFGRYIDIISLNKNKFGIHSVWLLISVSLSYAFIFAYAFAKRKHYAAIGLSAIVLSVTGIIIFADALAQGGAALRSVIYIPLGIAIIVACAYTICGKASRLILVSVCGLAFVGNSTVNNHLFSSSVSAEFRDRMLAENIINEARRLRPDKNLYTVRKVEVVGNHMWPITSLQSKTETFGASFFEWDGGNRYRVAAYLRLNGFSAVGVSNEDSVRLYERVKHMPAWPDVGWISMIDDVLVLKFGDYSEPQKSNLCAQGVVDLCGKSAP